MRHRGLPSDKADLEQHIPDSFGHGNKQQTPFSIELYDFSSPGLGRTPNLSLSLQKDPTFFGSDYALQSSHNLGQSIKVTANSSIAQDEQPLVKHSNNSDLPREDVYYNQFKLQHAITTDSFLSTNLINDSGNPRWSYTPSTSWTSRPLSYHSFARFADNATSCFNSAEGISDTDVTLRALLPLLDAVN
ncbi:hypothetical protein B0O99DRAFT_682023 [Bisporella sp. PMI_857]|nr:hypothetical protein B0O99DRAFT_682023 [Bisporella sp. PMI_857]